MTILQKNKIYFRNNPLVKTPTLRVLSQQNLDGPDPVQIMYVSTFLILNVGTLSCR